MKTNITCKKRGAYSRPAFSKKTKIGQNGRPGRREPPESISFVETSRMISVWGRRRKVFFWLLDATRGGQRSNFSRVPRHRKARLEGPTYMLKKDAAPFLTALDLPILPLCAVAEAKSWTFLVESWTFDRREYVPKDKNGSKLLSSLKRPYQ